VGITEDVVIDVSDDTPVGRSLERHECRRLDDLTDEELGKLRRSMEWTGLIHIVVARKSYNCEELDRIDTVVEPVSLSVAVSIHSGAGDITNYVEFDSEVTDAHSGPSWCDILSSGQCTPTNIYWDFRSFSLHGLPPFLLGSPTTLYL
jgi:hypothetical protein